MKFLKAGQLQTEFRKHLKKSTHVYIAVAWATKACPVIKDLENRTRDKDFGCLKFVVGLSGTITTPSLLERFSKNKKCILKEGTAKRTFHPKVYIFKYKSGEIYSWIGSANLTSWAFNSHHNEEVISEIKGSSKKSLKWFNEIFDNSAPINDIRKMIYEEEYKRRPNKPPQEETKSPDHRHKKQGSGKPSGSARPVYGKENIIDLGHPKHLMTNDLDWEMFIERIHIADCFWKEFSEKNSNRVFKVYPKESGVKRSWVDTISYVQDSDRGLMQRKNILGSLKNTTDVHAIFGFERPNEHADHSFALLGRYRSGIPIIDSSGEIKQPQAIKNLNRDLNDFMSVPKENGVDMAVSILKKIKLEKMKNEKAYKGVGIAIITRLFALARPDIAVSVNGRFSLNQWDYYRDKLDNPDNYGKLLKWVHEQSWHGGLEASEPKNLSAFDKRIWSMRAALIDVFAYEGGG